MPTSSSQSRSQPPFPTRFPPPPRLALARRAPLRDGAPPLPPPAADASPVEQFARQMELAIALRERAVADAETRLAERIRDLDELEALLRAREALLAAARLRQSDTRGVVTLREAEALEQLRAELDRQETSLRETRQQLAEREQFLERGEAQLLARLQQQQERETELDQRAESLAAREARLPAATAPRPYDEFRE